MPKISAALRSQLQKQPDRSVALIVRTSGNVTPHLDWFHSINFEVTQTYRLSPGVAGVCQGRNALQLLTQDWIISIEEDTSIQTA